MAGNPLYATPQWRAARAVFEWEPDEEGLVDCPECGIWWKPGEYGDPGPVSTRGAA